MKDAPANILTMPDRSGGVGDGSVTGDSGDTAALLTPPAGLTADEQVVWTQLAPHAITERTLSPATAAGFQQLCRHWVYAEGLAATITKFGSGTKEANGYVLTYLKAGQRLDTLLARFKLTAFGKPAVVDKPKAKVNPWAAVGGK